MRVAPCTVSGPVTDKSERPDMEPEVVWMFVATIVSALREAVFVVA
jgi:hypothetical protein